MSSWRVKARGRTGPAKYKIEHEPVCLLMVGGSGAPYRDAIVPPFRDTITH